MAVRQLVDRLQFGELFQAYLAEDYDGISQYATISLNRESVTSALRVKVTVGDLNLGRSFEAGTPVFVYSERGQLTLLNLGGGGGPALTYRANIAYDAAEPREVDLSPGVLGINSGEAISSPTLWAGSVKFTSPTGIAGVGIVGLPRLVQDKFIVPSGLASGELIGSPFIYRGLLLAPSSIASAGAFGSHTLIPVARVLPVGIISSESVRPPAMLPLFSDSIAGAGSITNPPIGVTSIIADVSAFTTEADDPTALGPLGNGSGLNYTAWIKLVLDTSMTLALDTYGSGMLDTIIALFDSQPISSSAITDWNDDNNLDPNRDSLIHSVLPDGVDGYTGDGTPGVYSAGTYWICIFPYTESDWLTAEATIQLNIRRSA